MQKRLDGGIINVIPLRDMRMIMPFSFREKPWCKSNHLFFHTYKTLTSRMYIVHSLSIRTGRREGKGLLIRRYHEADIDPIVTLFYETVHTVNKKDYSEEQLHAWASREEEKQKRESWMKSLRENIAFVAEIDGQIVGFSDMNRQGYLDRLFVHKDYQGQGIASALVSRLESEAIKLRILEMDTDASITAKPFFEAKGYRAIRSQIVERNGTQLMNYRMKKRLNERIQ